MPPYSYQLRHDRNGRIIEKQETVAEKSVNWKYSYDRMAVFSRPTWTAG